MKKIRFFSFIALGIGVVGGLLFLAGCQKKTVWDALINFQGKEVIQLDVFNNQTNATRENAVTMSWFFEPPFNRHCNENNYLITKKNLSAEELLTQIDQWLTKKGIDSTSYELPTLADDEVVRNIIGPTLYLSQFPLIINGREYLSGKVLFSNLAMEYSGDLILINGIKDPQKPSYIAISTLETNSGIWISLSNEVQDIPNSYSGYPRFERNNDIWTSPRSLSVIKIVTGEGYRFWEITMKHQLGNNDYFLPQVQIDYSTCLHVFYAENRPKTIKIHKEIPYQVSFRPLITNASLSEAKLLKITDKKTENSAPIESLKPRLQDKTLNFPTENLWKKRFYEELPVKIELNENPELSFSVPSDGDYELFAVDGKEVYHLYFETLKSEPLKRKDNKESMVLTIFGQGLLTGAGLTGQLNQLLGSWNFSFEVQNLGFNRYKGWEQEKIGKSNLIINYFIEPNQTITGNLLVKDRDGKEYPVALNLLVKEIPDARISRDLFSQALNVLPSVGHRSNTIKIWSKNTKLLKLYTQSCALNPQGDFSDEKRKEILSKRTSSTPVEESITEWGATVISYQEGVEVVSYQEDELSKTTPTELHFFDCKGEIQEHSIPVQGFRYWKRSDRERSLPESLKEQPYFRISFDKEMKDAKYYMRSPIGLFAKVAPYNELLIRAVNYETGKSVNQGMISISNATGGTLMTTSMKTEGVSFPIKDGNEEKYFVRYADSEQKADTFLILNSNGKSDPMGVNTQSISRLKPQQTKQQEARYASKHMIKIYGYTDRGLYKPWDTVHFAGFVQNMATINDKQAKPLSGVVIVEASPWREDQKQKIVFTQLDAFGGFEGSFTLTEKTPLGGRGITFIYAEDPEKTSLDDFDGNRFERDNYRATHSFDSYQTNFLVNEFQKFSFQTKLKKAVKDNQLYLELIPEYYMGGELKDYDLTLAYSISTNNDCEGCRWKEESDFYYNYLFNDYFHQGGEIKKEHLTGGSLIFQLGDLSKIGYKGNKLTLKATAYVKDNLSDETRESTEYLDLDPEVKIGLDGFAYDWLDSTLIKDYRINAKIEKNLHTVANVEYQRYFRSFGFNQKRDAEGTYYYINGSEKKLIQTWTLKPTSEFSIPLLFDQYQGGEYFLRVITKDKKGITNGEVDKSIYYYDTQFEKGFQGDMENNYSLHVHIPKKNYQPWKPIPITISPYIKGATALLTVEKGNQILDRKLVPLDGKPLALLAKEDYYPNVQISVTEFVGETVNSQLGGSGEQKRKEPAFFAGYAEALMQEDLKKINIQLATDKTDYQPWEKVKVKILTTDYKGQALTARVSLSVVDKALSDLYDVLKEPIPYFYSRMGSSIGNFGNWKNLYYALRTFFANGEKGGGGGADESLKNLRKKFYDLAYRKAGIITTWGKAEIEFTLPDNLTTWMLDAIAVSQRTKLGTQRAYFKVNQPLTIEANLPTFVTIGDELHLPLRLLADTAHIKLSEQALVQGAIKAKDGTTLQPFKKEGSLNSKFWTTIKVDASYFDQKELHIVVSAQAGKYRDEVERKIPIRTEGLVNKQFSFEQNKKGSKIFNFEDTANRGTLTARLAPFPTAVLSAPFHQLLDPDPISSEAIIRTAQTALEAKKLTDWGLLSGTMVQSGQVLLANGKWKSLTSILEETLQQLGERQDREGAIREWKEFSPSESGLFPPEEKRTLKINPKTSIATFALLETMRTSGFEQLIPKTFSSKLDSYLSTLGNNTPELYLYYLAQKKTKLETINTAVIEQIKKAHPNNIAVQSLSFMLLARKGNMETSVEEAKKLNDLFNQAFQLGKYFDAKLMDLKALQGYAMKGLLIAHKRFPTNQELKNLISTHIISLLKSRTSDGIRSRSPETNFQVLEAINQALESYYTGQNQSTSCSLNVEGEEFALKSETTCTEISIPFGAKKAVTVDRNCEGSAFLDLELNYLLEDSSKKKTELHNVENFWLHLPSSSTIGEKIPLNATLKTLKEAQNLTVEFHIPADLKFRASKNPRESGFENGIFNFENDWDCFPNYYEFRFDRVLMQYDTLRAGKQCNFTFYALKAFDGDFVLPPSKLYEASATEVWGMSKIEKNKKEK